MKDKTLIFFKVAKYHELLSTLSHKENLFIKRKSYNREEVKLGKTRFNI